MKIVFVSDAIYPYNKGGKEKRLFELSTRLAKRGHDVHIYTMHWWSGSEKERTEHDVTLHAISKYYPMYHGERRSITEGIMFGLACFKLIRVKFDVIDVDHMPFFPIFSSWLVCLARGRKMFGTWHEALSVQDWTDYMGKAGYVAAAIEKMSVKLPYAITASSPHTKDLLALYHKRTKRVDLVTPGIDVNSLRSIKAMDIACDILYVGRFVKDKNVDKLIHAVALMAADDPNIRCIIIGHGVEERRLRNLVADLKVTRQVKIMKPLTEATDIYAYMKAAKVFCLPSVREGFGMVALEALGCGTPVVTTDAPANAAKDLIEPGRNGSTVRLEPGLLADALRHWVTKKRATGGNYAASFDWNDLAARQEGIYKL